MFFELTAEIIAVGKTCLVSDFSDSKLRILKKQRGFFQSDPDQELQR